MKGCKKVLKSLTLTERFPFCDLVYFLFIPFLLTNDQVVCIRSLLYYALEDELYTLINQYALKN